MGIKWNIKFMDSKHNMKTEFEHAFLLLSNKLILAPLPNPHHHHPQALSFYLASHSQSFILIPIIFNLKFLVATVAFVASCNNQT